MALSLQLKHWAGPMFQCGVRSLCSRILQHHSQKPTTTMTSTISTPSPTGATSTSSPEAFLANLSQPQASAKGLPTIGISGKKCWVIREARPTYVVAENVRGLVNWSEGLVFDAVCTDLEVKATKSCRVFFQLQVSGRPTSEIASGLLLTPTTRETVMDVEKFLERKKRNGYKNGTTVPNLATQMQIKTGHASEDGKASQMSPLLWRR